MVAYNFQPEFMAQVIEGRKTSTLRPARKTAHVMPGQDVHAFVGLRTVDRILLLTAPCIRSVPFELHLDRVYVDGRKQDGADYFEALARIEGFANFSNLQAWFDRRYGLPVLDLRQVCWDFGAASYVAGGVQ